MRSIRRSPVPVTPEMIDAIQRLTKYRIQQIDIAQRLSCSQSTVSRVQLKLGLRQMRAVRS